MKRVGSQLIRVDFQLLSGSSLMRRGHSCKVNLACDLFDHQYNKHGKCTLYTCGIPLYADGAGSHRLGFLLGRDR